MSSFNVLYPSHNAIIEISIPAWSRLIAVEWRNTCGVTDLFFSLWQFIDFGLIDEEGYINVLLGLDILFKLGVTINLKELKLETN